MREQGVQIIVSGMAAHNLRDLRCTFDRSSPMPYSTSFEETLKDAVTVAPAERERAMAALLKRDDARQAHPDFDHFVANICGARCCRSGYRGEVMDPERGSMSWAQYRFGDVAVS